MNVQLNISDCVAKKASGIYIAHLVRYCCKTHNVMRRALFLEWLKKTQSAVFILKLSFAHIKRLFPFAWFSHSSVCAFWGHFSKWCRYSFAVFWCYILCLCLWHIFSQLVNVVIIVTVCIHVPLTTLFQIDTVKTILYDFSGRNLWLLRSAFRKAISTMLVW